MRGTTVPDQEADFTADPVESCCGGDASFVDDGEEGSKMA